MKKSAVLDIAIGLYLLLGGKLIADLAFSRKEKNKGIVGGEWECAECGETVSFDDRVCPRCGADVTELEED